MTRPATPPGWESTLRDGWRQRHSWSTLTDRKAFVATALPPSGRRLKSWPITRDTVLGIDAKTPKTIVFAREEVDSGGGVRHTDIGFERVADDQTVHRLIRGSQKGTTP